jgi:hypothetical protein
MGGNPMKIPEFTAEAAELPWDAKEEKNGCWFNHVVHVPADMPAKPIVFRNVVSPVCMISYFVPTA